MLEHDSQTENSDSVQMEMHAAPESVGQVRHTVSVFLREQGWDEEDANSLLLAMGEACNNAVNYGGKGRLDPRLSVSCRSLGEHRLQVEVRNQGNGFHPDLETQGQMPDSELATHGRGFGLMLALVDSVQVLSDSGNTIIRLTKSQTF